MITVDVLNYDALQDTLEDRYHDVTDNIFDFESVSAGIDMGVLYQLFGSISSKDSFVI